ncbi:MAG: cytochrome c [Gemmatimonadota bacterium]|jgi:mono/diheme cytochrome c family protein
MIIVRERHTLRTLVPFLGLVLATGCAGSGGAPTAEPVAVPAPASPDFAGLEVARSTSPAHVDGWTLFTNNCGECHTLQPPGKTAPPMASVLRRYGTEYATRQDTRAAMVFWVRYPDAEWAVMPKEILRDHGLMPAPELSVDEVEEIVDYLLSLSAKDRAPR